MVLKMIYFTFVAINGKVKDHIILSMHAHGIADVTDTGNWEDA